MIVAASDLEGTALVPAALGTTFDRQRDFMAPGGFRRAAAIAGDVLGAVAIVLCIPFVIVALVAPIALCIQLLLWVGERL